MKQATNIVLIGMPGSGKSTLGRRLARHRNLTFIDTDLLLEQRSQMSVQDIVNRRGVRGLRRLESGLLSTLTLENHVIATGGSAIYSDSAMRNLCTLGACVYLKISLSTLVRRVNNVSSRGLAKMKSHPLPRLYADRADLYESSADIIINNDRPLTSLSTERLNDELDLFFEQISELEKRE